jgi:hypothetical protein
MPEETLGHDAQTNELIAGMARRLSMHTHAIAHNIHFWLSSRLTLFESATVQSGGTARANRNDRRPRKVTESAELGDA